jgi:dipeptidyl aminopeptidase/acylaminoacyl peptidase
MTSRRLALTALAAALLLVACGGDDPKPSTPPIAEVTAAPPPATTQAPQVGGGPFTPGPTARLAELQGVVWQRQNAGLLSYNRSTVQLTNPAGATSAVFTAGAGESVLSAADTGFVATQTGREITMRNVRVATAPTRHFTPGDQFTSAVLSPDGSLVAITLADRIAVQLWDVEEQRLLREFTGFQTAAPVYGVRFSPDGRALIWLARAKVQVMDLASGAFSPAVEHEDFVGALALTADRSTLVTAAGPKLTVWDVATGKQKLSEGQPGIVTSLALSPDSRTIAVATPQNVRLVDITSARETATLAAPNARNLAFSEDGKQLAVSDEKGGITIWRRP